MACFQVYWTNPTPSQCPLVAPLPPGTQTNGSDNVGECYGKRVDGDSHVNHFKKTVCVNSDIHLLNCSHIHYDISHIDTITMFLSVPDVAYGCKRDELRV